MTYTTRSGIRVTRAASRVRYGKGFDPILRELDAARGCCFSCSQWGMASVRPPLEIVACGRQMEFRPLNARGRAIARMLEAVLGCHPHWESLELVDGSLRGTF